MIATESNPGAPAASGGGPVNRAAAQFHRVEIGEPIDVLIGAYESWESLEALLRALPNPGSRAMPLTLVLHLPAGRGGNRAVGGAAPEALPWATALSDRLVLTYGDGHEALWSAANLHDLVRAALPADRHGRVLIEPEADRAVIGAMNWLGAGHTLVVLCAGAAGVPAAVSRVRRGARWRAALAEPEEGDFRSAPPPDDFR